MHESTKKLRKDDGSWQARLLPLMSRMLVGLTVFFFIVSLIQLSYLHWNIQQSPDLNLFKELSDIDTKTTMSFEQQFRQKQFRVLTEMDLSAMERRHHQANVLLMSRVWTRYIGFVTGMILAMVGCVFILGKLREPVSELELKRGDLGASIKSASPGIILTFLGVVLMIITIVVHHRIEVADAPSYMRLIQLDGIQSVKPPLDEIPAIKPPIN